MTSLADVYEGQVGEQADRRRLYLGVGSFCLGAVLAVAGIVVAGSSLTTGTLGLGTAREYGGILAGIGVPAVFLGIFTVLPAGKVTRAAAVVGTGIALLGVTLFAHAYPCQWSGSTCAATGGDLTLLVSAVYSAGVLTTFWCLFVGVANFTSRNDPGGTVELEITRNGETKIVEVPESQLDDGAAGGVGFFGDTPDGNVATQTARSDPEPVVDTEGGVDPSVPSDGGAEVLGEDSPTGGSGTGSGGSGIASGSSGLASGGSGGGWPSEGTPRASDGGPGGVETHSGTDESPLENVDDVSGPSSRGVTEETTAGSARGATPPADSSHRRQSDSSNEIREVEPSDAATTPGDSYCGSCAHFQYVRTEEGMQPYCGYHDEVMDDMDACSEWTPR